MIQYGINDTEYGINNTGYRILPAVLAVISVSTLKNLSKFLKE